MRLRYPADLDSSLVEQLWEGDPGSAPGWASFMAIVGWLLTLGIVVIGLYSFHNYLPHAASLSVAGGLLISAVCFMVVRRHHPVSRWLRALDALPLVHLGILLGACALYLWALDVPFLREVYRHTTVVVIGLVAAAFLVVVTAFTRRRGAPAFLRANVYLGAGMLVTTGVWAPYAARLTTPGSVSSVLVIVMPGLMVGGLAAWAGTARTLPRVGSVPLTALGSALLLGATISIGLGSPDPARLLAPHVPVLFAQAFYLLVAIGGLALEHRKVVRAVMRARKLGVPWCQEGTIVVDDETPVAVVRYDGWLGGVSTLCHRFRLATRSAVLDVSAGARLAVPVPLWTSRARPQSARAVLRGGDRVIVTGFVSPLQEGPLRTQSGPIAGSSGLCVSTITAPAPWLDISLLTWRMAALYVGIALLVALPFLNLL